MTTNVSMPPITTVSMPPAVKKLLAERAGDRPIYKMLLSDFLHEPDLQTLVELKFQHQEERLDELDGALKEQVRQTTDIVGLIGKLESFVKSLLSEGIGGITHRIDALQEQADHGGICFGMLYEMLKKGDPIPPMMEFQAKSRLALDSWQNQSQGDMLKHTIDTLRAISDTKAMQSDPAALGDLLAEIKRLEDLCNEQ